jgi:hypothetical protein
VCIPSAFSSNVGLLGLPSCEVVASELSEVELLSPLSSSGHWSGPCLLDVLSSAGECLTYPGYVLPSTVAAHLYHETSSLRHFGVATSFYPTHASRWVGNGWLCLNSFLLYAGKC